MKATLSTIIAALSGLSLIAGAEAAQITLGNSTSGTFDFTGVPPASLTVGSPGISGNGQAFFPPDSGNYVFAAMAPTAAGPLVGGNFATAASQSLTVTMGDGDIFSGLIAWSLVKDHSSHPDLDGVLTITNAQGDASWLAAFPAGGTADIDLALTLYPGPLLDQITAAGASQWATISSGEIVPTTHPIPVPEPWSAGLLMVSLAGLAMYRVMRGP